MATFSELVTSGASCEALAAHLDSLPPRQRVAEVLALPGRLISPLFERVRGAGVLRLDEFVDRVEETVTYALKNNLPLFKVSEKRFYRERTGEVIGYNRTGALTTAFAGPGYFLATETEDGELVFDYSRSPALRPPGWPPQRANVGLFAGMVYGQMIDRVRRVSRDTAVGAAFRHGAPRGAWFLLTRV